MSQLEYGNNYNQGVCELVDSGKWEREGKMETVYFSHDLQPWFISSRDVQQPVHGFGPEESGAAEVTP